MKNREYKDYKNFPKNKWRWPDFTPREIASKGDRRLKIDEASMDRLQLLRDYIGHPIYLTSAYRSAKHNKAVGGAKNSYHMQGRAFDVQMRDMDPTTFEILARRAGFTGFGFYPPPDHKSPFIHVDTGPAREWGRRWKAPAQKLGVPVVEESPAPTKTNRNWLESFIVALVTIFTKILKGK